MLRTNKNGKPQTFKGMLDEISQRKKHKCKTYTRRWIRKIR